MKKVIVFLFVVSLLYLINNNNNTTIIPNDSIRYRIIASSDNPSDQLLKWRVNEKVLPIIIDSLDQSDNLIAAERSIKNNLSVIDKSINTITSDYTMSYGYNHFPKKTFNGMTYEEDDYLSLVITLGDGKGENWWCVLFPPLCLMEATKTDEDYITYDLFFKKALNLY